MHADCFSLLAKHQPQSSRGGGTSPYDFVGSCVVNTLTMNGHFHIHYDESLNKLNPSAYVACSWNEVDSN